MPSRRSLVVPVLVLLVALAAGCGAVTELIQLTERVRRAGYTDVQAFHDDFGQGRNEVQIDAAVGRGAPPPAGQGEIAEIVWDTYPRRFDRISVELDGQEALFLRADLEAEFGPRDTVLDERAFSDDITSTIRTASLIGGLVLLVVIVGVVLLVRRSRRRRAAMPVWAPPPPGYRGPPPPGYRGPPPPGYGGPPPPGAWAPPAAPPPSGGPGTWPPPSAPPPPGAPPPPSAPPPPGTPPPPSAPPADGPGRPSDHDWPPPAPGGPHG